MLGPGRSKKEQNWKQKSRDKMKLEEETRTGGKKKNWERRWLCRSLKIVCFLSTENTRGENWGGLDTS